MPLKPSKINLFTMLKLPAAYLMGVRVRNINEAYCITTVKHRWINQNPFKSMFWAVQGMAAELCTGALVMSYIKETDSDISMLVLNNNASFSKKGRGRLVFRCDDGQLIKNAIAKTIKDGSSQTCWMKSVGVDEAGDQVSTFNFEWTLKKKSSK